MKRTHKTGIPLMVILPTLCLGLVACDRTQNTNSNSSPSQTQSSQTSALPEAEQQRVMPASYEESEAQARPDLEERRKAAQQQAEKSLDQDAIAAIAETGKAIKAIAENKTSEALAAIERANGKVNILLARNPTSALLPVEVEVALIDTAPLQIPVIRDRVKAVDAAVDIRDLPTARVLLHTLMSEIRIRTTHLPLATYPTALKEAARLLDQKDNARAADLLLTALNTLVIVDRVMPLPLILAQREIEEAQTVAQTDKNRAKTLLANARYDLNRAKELGYTGDDPEYAALSRAISDLEKQVAANQDTGSVFDRLKERLAAFFKRQSESQRR